MRQSATDPTSCVGACLLGVIARNEKSGHSHKCTVCLDRVRDGLQPACAKTCPAASIRFGRLEDMRNAARNRLAHLRAQGVSNARLYGLEPTENYSSLHNIFLLLDRPSTYGLPELPCIPPAVSRETIFARQPDWFSARP